MNDLLMSYGFPRCYYLRLFITQYLESVFSVRRGSGSLPLSLLDNPPYSSNYRRCSSGGFLLYTFYSFIVCSPVSYQFRTFLWMGLLDLYILIGVILNPTLVLSVHRCVSFRYSSNVQP